MGKKTEKQLQKMGIRTNTQGKEKYAVNWISTGKYNICQGES